MMQAHEPRSAPVWGAASRAASSPTFRAPDRWPTAADLGLPPATDRWSINQADPTADDPKRELTSPGPGPTEEPKDVGRQPELTAGLSTPPGTGVRTILRPGRLPETRAAVGRPPEAFDRSARSIVAPGGAPTVNNAAAGNDCTPASASTVLGWSVVSADAANWRPDVTSLALAGQVNVHPWPSLPATMTVPNTANPVVGGNIDNTAGGTNHWQAAIDDMADYHTVGGGAGPNWHSTAASSAHEWAHWNIDWLIDSVGSAAGGNWPQTNADIDALRQPKAASATTAAAHAALRPRVEARLRTWRTQAVARWNAIPDTPGVAGSTGYNAGKAVLDTQIAAVRAFATAQGWTGAPAGGAPGGGAPAGGSPAGAAPAAPAGATGMSTGAKAALGAVGGAIVGAGIGAFAGPIGALVGAGIGALIGGFGSLFF